MVKGPIAAVAAWLGGSLACVDTGARPDPDGARVWSCEVPAPLPYSGPAMIPSEDTSEPGPYVWKNVVIKGGGFVSGIITSQAMAGLVFGRTDIGGAYRSDPSNPANHRWMPITDWAGRDEENLTGIESIAADPVDPNKVYIAAGQYVMAGSGVILSSTDMGRTWTRNNLAAPMGGNVNGRSMGERLAIDPNLTSTLYFASRSTGLWKSTDFAQSWLSNTGFPVTGEGPCNFTDNASDKNCGLSFVVFDPRSGTRGSASQTIYVGVAVLNGPTLYRSTDGGASWQEVAGAPTGMMPHHAVPDGCGNLYLAYNDFAGPNDIRAGAVWRHNMASGEWREVSPPKAAGGFGGLSADVTRPGTLVVTTINRWENDRIYRTTDGGTTWTDLHSGFQRDVDGAQWLFFHRTSLSTPGWMGDIEIDPFNPARALFVTGQGIWSSSDLTAADTGAPTHWRFDNDGLEETVPLDLISPPSGEAHLLSGLGDIAGFRHVDFNVSPPGGSYSNPMFGNTNSLDFAEFDPNIVARVGTPSGNQARGAYSTNGGATWMPFTGEPPLTQAAMMMMPPPRPASGSIAVSADGATFVWAPQQNGVPSYSRNRGATWIACAGYTSGTRVAADRVNPMKFYASGRNASGENRMYVSTDGGATFVQAGAVANAKPRPVFGHEGELWATTSTGLFHSWDSAASWTQLPNISAAASVGFGKAADGRSYPAVFLAGAVYGIWGVYRSDDTGATWQRIDDPQHQFGSINCLTGYSRIFGRVYFGTDGRGVHYGDPR